MADLIGGIVIIIILFIAVLMLQNWKS